MMQHAVDQMLSLQGLEKCMAYSEKASIPEIEHNPSAFYEKGKTIHDSLAACPRTGVFQKKPPLQLQSILTENL